MMFQQEGNLFFQNTCIDFSANINFLGIPDAVMEAARSGLVAAMLEVQQHPGALNEHVAAWEGVEPEQVYCGVGPSEIIRNLLWMLKPKKALLPSPGFEEYLRALSMAQCGIDYFYTKQEDGFRIPVQEFLSYITQETDVVFWCNPNNPAAVLYRREELEQVVIRCEQTGTLLILDECCLDFVECAGEVTMRSKDASRSLFIVKDFTKMFAMPGIRLGYGLCTDQELMGKLRSAVQMSNVSAVAQKAGIACTGEREFVQRTVQEIAKERAWLLEELRRIKITQARGEANIIFFKSRPKLHTFSVMHGILLRDCSNFEGLEEGWYRIAVRGREENKKLIAMLEQWQREA